MAASSMRKRSLKKSSRPKIHLISGSGFRSCAPKLWPLTVGTLAQH